MGVLANKIFVQLRGSVATMSPVENPSWLRSRNLAFMPLLLGLVVDGAGVVMFDEMSSGVDFFQNPVVWFGLVHAAYCIVLSIGMFATDWKWTSSQFGFFSLSLLSMAYVSVGGYLVIALYSAASGLLKACLLLALLLVYAWWVGKILTGMAVLYGSARWLGQVFVEEPEYMRFLQRREIDIRGRVPGLGLQPAGYAVLAGGAVSLLIVIFRERATGYFGVELVPLVVAPLGFSLGLMFVAMIAVSVLLYFVIPSLVRRKTGKTVYVDVNSNPIDAAILEYSRHKTKRAGPAAGRSRR